jgi:hypothetical protein
MKEKKKKRVLLAHFFTGDALGMVMRIGGGSRKNFRIVLSPYKPLN